MHDPVSGNVEPRNLIARSGHFFTAHLYSAVFPVLLCIGIALIVFSIPKDRVLLVDAYENAAYTIDPSPARAYEYGARHLDAESPTMYDIGRAEHFFRLAAAKDPGLPYVYHELARIDFLKGSYQPALDEINLQIKNHGDATPNAYYVRGLIEGYMRSYDAAAADYKHFLQFDPRDWAAINDYAWILLKLNRPQEAADATSAGLASFPGNPWLLNTNAIALYEIGAFGPARQKANAAIEAVAKITESDWLHAYPGNDPTLASQGIAVFKKATLDNMHSILLASASSTLQYK